MPVEYIPDPIKADINVVTGTRAFTTLYTNNNNRPMLVLISCTHTINIAGSFCLVQLQINAAGSAWGGYFNTPAIGIVLYSTVVGIVPANGTYQLLQNAAGGVNAIIQWTEVIL